MPILHMGNADSVGQHGRHCGTLLRHAALAMSLEPVAGGKAGQQRCGERVKPADPPRMPAGAAALAHTP